MDSNVEERKFKRNKFGFKWFLIVERSESQ